MITMTVKQDTQTITLPETDFLRLVFVGLRQLLRQLPDPLGTERKSGTYFVEIGRFCKKTAQTPKVYLRLADEYPAEQYVNGGPRSYGPVIEIDIRVRDQGKGTIMGVEYTGQELQLAIFDLVANHIDTNSKGIDVTETKGNFTNTYTAIDFIFRSTAGKCFYEEKTESWTMKSLWQAKKHKPT